MSEEVAAKVKFAFEGQTLRAIAAAVGTEVLTLCCA